LGDFFDKVIAACDGEDALKQYQNYFNDNGCYVDLVITDINMPKKDGISLIQDIYLSNENQAVIVMSAHSEPEYLLPLMEEGISNFLLKPVKMENMIKVLFKTCQIIDNNSALDGYIEEIEILNAELASKNSELLRKSRVVDGLMQNAKSDKQVKKSEEANESSKDSQINKIDENQSKHDDELKEMLAVEYADIIDIYEVIDAEMARIALSAEKLDTDEINMENVAELMSKFSQILSRYGMFKGLYSAISELCDTFIHYPVPEDKEHRENVFVILETFLYMLGKWLGDWQKGDLKSIEEFSISVIGDIETIITMWTSTGATESDDDFEEIEFF
jgi:YesN/AraC family two-component response regulator